jgi:hypothetical protein
VITIACFGIIREMRALNRGDLGKSENQLVTSAELAQKTVQSSNPFGHIISESTVNRAAGSISLLSDVIEAHERGYDFIYGEMFVNSLFNLIPRAVWAEKPALESFQTQIRRHFGLRIIDDPASLLIYLYANGGGLAVLAGFYCLGWVLAKLSEIMESTAKVAAWVFSVFIWTSVLQIEQETVLLTLSTLRTAVVVVVGYKMSHMVFTLLSLRLRPSRSQTFQGWEQRQPTRP